MSAYTLDNEAFGGLIVYGSLALMKTALMVPLTIYARRKNKNPASSEDAKFFFDSKDGDNQKKLLQPNENVERVRRAHLNDLENVIPFVILGSLYVGTHPNPSTALWHFKIFFFSRVLHTIVYVKEIRQPFRALAFMAGLGTFFSMACRTVLATYKFL